jgi:6,7-dimethyl-8-ribityllumazine synthase
MSAYEYLKNNTITIPDAHKMRLGIVVCEWNNNITDVLLEGAINTLKSNGIDETNILVKRVPGSFELIYGCSQMLKQSPVDAVIAIGCVIKGDTPHFDYICSATTQGLTTLNTLYDKPVIFGVLTVNTLEQALERTGGNLGNKGDEFAVTAIKMIDYTWSLKK